MGWGDGSYILDIIWEEVTNYIPREEKVRIGKRLIDTFEYYDMDNKFETKLFAEMCSIDPDYDWKENISEFVDKLSDVECAWNEDIFCFRGFKNVNEALDFCKKYLNEVS